MMQDYDISLLRKMILDHFSVEELRVLCQDLDMNYEELTGDNRASKIGELIEYFKRHVEMPKLMSKIREARANVNWEPAIQTDRPAEPVSPPVFTLSVVIVAMTHAEAKKLRQSHDDSIHQVLSRVDSSFNQDFSERYHEERDQWHPFASPIPINQVLEEFSRQTIISENGDQKIFYVEFAFYSTQFFSDPERDVLTNLETSRCVLVVDEISLLDPTISARLSFFLHKWEPDVLFFISPMDFRKQELNKLLEEYAKRCYPALDTEIEDRLSLHRGLHISNKPELHRCLKVSLKALRPSKHFPKGWSQWA